MTKTVNQNNAVSIARAETVSASIRAVMRRRSIKHASRAYSFRYNYIVSHHACTRAACARAPPSWPLSAHWIDVGYLGVP